jgi:hypothetical protein
MKSNYVEVGGQMSSFPLRHGIKISRFKLNMGDSENYTQKIIKQ